MRKPTDSPVFVDGSGTRRRWFIGLGAAGAGVLAVAVLLLVAGFLGGGPGRLPGLPGLPAPAGPAARQAELAPTVSGSGSPHSVRASASSSHATTPAGTPSPTPVAPPSPSPSPSPTRHGNAPPHPSHKK